MLTPVFGKLVARFPRRQFVPAVNLFFLFGALAFVPLYEFQDAIGAKAFGFRTFWINRTGAPVDRHGPPPDRILSTLADLAPLLA